jgi:hypothetical protein
MPRLYIFAEGQTEQTYGDTVLKHNLATFGVYVQGPILIAHAKKKGRVHRGGGREYLPMRNDIVRLLAQEKANDTYFTTMIDLYAIHSDFPGLAEAEKVRHLPRHRVEQLEQAFANDINDRRFIPHIQLHEFEAILFVDPTAFETFYADCAKQVGALQAIAQAHESPEEIDDGLQTAPSKRIIDQFPDYEGAKRTAGPQIAASIGLDAIRVKCPHFDAWLTRLEKLGPDPVSS